MPQRGLKNPGGPRRPRDGARHLGGDRGQEQNHRGQGAGRGVGGRVFPARDRSEFADSSADRIANGIVAKYSVTATATA